VWYVDLNRKLPRTSASTGRVRPWFYWLHRQHIARTKVRDYSFIIWLMNMHCHSRSSSSSATMPCTPTWTSFWPTLTLDEFLHFSQSSVYKYVQLMLLRVVHDYLYHSMTLRSAYYNHSIFTVHNWHYDECNPMYIFYCVIINYMSPIRIQSVIYSMLSIT
jgi:hypothetical protein